MNLTDLKKELVTLAEGSIEDITNPQFIRLLNRAIFNRYEEVRNMCEESYMLEVTLTASSESYDIDLPDNFYFREDRNVWHVYDDASFTCMAAGKGPNFWRKGKKLRFATKLNSQEKVYLLYSKAPTRYTSMDETFLEDEAMETLLSEVQALYYGAIDENEPNASYSNTLAQANRSAL